MPNWYFAFIHICNCKRNQKALRHDITSVFIDTAFITLYIYNSTSIDIVRFTGTNTCHCGEEAGDGTPYCAFTDAAMDLRSCE
jgi:hypothetical protein